MKIKIQEANLNLRVDRRNHPDATNMSYSLGRKIAEAQLYQTKNADFYCNVEYMQCQDSEYLQCFTYAGYQPITATFGKDKRGIIALAKKEIEVTIVKRMEDPHFLHLHAIKDKEGADIIVFRILTYNSSDKDFRDRRLQWDKVMKYIDTEISDPSKTILTGDWNHAKIRTNYQGEPQRFFSYQLIEEDLNKRKLSMGMKLSEGHSEHSYMGHLAIDHIAIGQAFCYTDEPSYSPYQINAPIGTPDHAFISAEITSCCRYENDT